jgi:hypothetical protein
VVVALVMMEVVLDQVYLEVLEVVATMMVLVVQE